MNHFIDAESKNIWEGRNYLNKQLILVKYGSKYLFIISLTNWICSFNSRYTTISVVEHHRHFWFYNSYFNDHLTHRSLRWQGQVLLFPFYRFNKRFREVKMQGCHSSSEADTFLIILSR